MAQTPVVAFSSRPPHFLSHRKCASTARIDSPVDYENRETATYRTHEAAKLLNTYKSKPSPGSNSKREELGDQVSAIDNY